MGETALRNWAGNYTFAAARVHRPETVEEVRALVAAGGRVRALGSRHSFNGLADTGGDLISLERLDRMVTLDPARRRVTVEGGIRYGALARALHAAGWALPNLASLPHISVGGACATATHGSGDTNACLAASVAAVELVAGDGSLVSLSRERDGERFGGAAVSLGALGVAVRLTLDVVPAFRVRQDVYEALPVARLERDFDAITSSGYSVSLFTDWADGPISQVWVKRRVADGEATGTTGTTGTAGTTTATTTGFFGATPAAVKRHPITALPAENCTEQLGTPGPWHERLPHFRMEHTPSSGLELQSEYFVPRAHAVAAFRAIAALRDEIRPLIQISEVRTVAADNLWLSPFFERDTVAFHFTWLPDWPAVAALLPRIEAQLAPLEARPHWGKLFTLPPERVRALYPRMGDFRALARALDPDGRFSNELVERYVLHAG